MENFSDFNAWGGFNLIACLLIALLVANLVKKSIPFLHYSLIPTSVIGGVILLVISSIYEGVTGDALFNAPFFGGNGCGVLELITYHSLALGFIATTFKSATRKFTKERSREIFDSGVTTVASYVMQGILGLGITIIAAFIIPGFFKAAGVLLPFGYGQGTGQAMNYGTIFETTAYEGGSFVGGKSFGLTIAALGFLSASIGGVVHLAILKKRGVVTVERHRPAETIPGASIQAANEIFMNGSIDKTTVQVAFVALTYALTYGLMSALGALAPGMKSTIFGFNFLLGVLVATLIKKIMALLNRTGIVKRQYFNDFLMTRISGFFFDIMVIAGVAAIRLTVLKAYWGIILILGVVGAFATYFFNRFIAKKFFPEYSEEQFLVMFGMLTGTASTGIILLREIDPDFKTPASENLVYQQFPAILFGLPMMFVATMAPKNPELTLGILVPYFLLMMLILFRRSIFKKRAKKEEKSDD